MITSIYTSRLALDAAYTCVSGILHQSRIANSLRGITGLLIFDGRRFCQFLEGPDDVVHELKKRIQRDSRHDHFEPLFNGPSDGRRFGSSSMGYGIDHDGEAIDGISAAARGQTSGVFLAWLPRLDMMEAGGGHALVAC